MITESPGQSSSGSRATVSDCAVIYAWDYGDEIKSALREEGLYDQYVALAQDHGEARIPGDAIAHGYRTNSEGEEEFMRGSTAPVSVIVSPCHFGGIRVWFECPGLDDESPCGNRVGALYLAPGQPIACRECLGLTYECRTRHREFMYEHVSKPVNELRQILDRLERNNEITPADIVDLYEAEREACTGMAAFNHRAEQAADRLAEMWGTPKLAEPTTPEGMFAFPSFEEWLARKREMVERRSRRAYGPHGRCTATAKSADRRCRQPSVGDHGKCFYHGGAPGSGYLEEEPERRS